VAKYLYHIGNDGTAMRYGVAVGRQGLQSPGTFTINRKVEWPSWTPTANMIRASRISTRSSQAAWPGGPDNPLGARALYLYRGGADSMLRIHGTPQPWSIGTSASSGCVRLVNDHVMQLYETCRSARARSCIRPGAEPGSGKAGFSGRNCRQFRSRVSRQRAIRR
jgi:lipoprotein-anchoring transpeptidase ErfK/SrfK